MIANIDQAVDGDHPLVYIGGHGQWRSKIGDRGGISVFGRIGRIGRIGLIGRIGDHCLEATPD